MKEGMWWGVSARAWDLGCISAGGFLRALNREGSLKDYVLQFVGQAGKLTTYKFFVNQSEIQDER